MKARKLLLVIIGNKFFKEEAKAGEQLFFRVDSHYNELGNKVVTEEIYAYFNQYLAG